MPSSTSSSERLTAADRPGVAQPVPVRDIPDRPWTSMLLGALLLAVLLTGAWEWYWRAYGVTPGIRNDDALWAQQRRRIDAGDGNRTVLIGASRTFFDLQLPVWERLSGQKPIQLALDGTSPAFAVEDLADDAAFKGRLLIGVAPDVVFSGFELSPGLARFARKQSPSQRIGKILSMHLLEPWLAFYDEDFALFTVLRRQSWLDREGLSYLSVRKLGITEADRNNYMWSKLETDSGYQQLFHRIWSQDFNDPPPTPAEAAEDKRTLDEQIRRISAAVARLRARNVPVIFVREPSSGDYYKYESRVFPRQTTWDVLLQKAQARGIHFDDYRELQGFDLPDWSHMSRSSAEHYTAVLYGIIQREYPLPDGERW